MDTIESRENERKMNFDFAASIAAYILCDIGGDILKVYHQLGIQDFRYWTVAAFGIIGVIALWYFPFKWFMRYSQSDLMLYTMADFEKFVHKIIFRRK